MPTVPPPASATDPRWEQPSAEGPLRREPQNIIRELLDRLNQLLNLSDFSRGDVLRD